MTIIEEILEFWFGKLESDNYFPKEKSVIWFRKSEETDQLIRDRFEKTLLEVKQGATQDWDATPRGTLALIILLDQFSRNMYRDSPKAFERDPIALELSLKGMRQEQEQPLRPLERIFFYMPLMHSEKLEDQKQCIACFEKLLEICPSELRKMVENNLDYAHKHCVIIERFGRFPHRNEVLGRTSTPEETEFLKQPGSRF